MIFFADKNLLERLYGFHAASFFLKFHNNVE